MGRGRKARTTAATNVVGATPATEEQPFANSIQQRQAAQDAVLGEDAAVRRKQPAKLKPTNFFTAPPRTQIFEESDNADGTNDMTFKKRAAAAAPANLGEISGMIWAKTSSQRGGAKDPSAAPAARVGHVMEELAELDEGGEAAALMSAEGFKAYADDSIWGVRAPGEADEAPLDVEDAIQVKDRLQHVWANWRKLTAQQQRTWAERQLAKEGAAAVKRGTGKAVPKTHGSLWAAESTEAMKAIGAYSSRRKPDGWGFSKAPTHAGRNGKDAAAELEALQEQLKDAADAADAADKQPAGSADQRKQKKRARKQAEAEAAAAAERQHQLEEEVSEAQWRRASALRRSKPALLAEMAVWEREAEEKEAAAEAGISVQELRKQRKRQEAADAAAAEADRREQEGEEEDAAEQEGEEEEGADADVAGGGGGGGVGRKGRANKAPAAAAVAAAGQVAGKKARKSKTAAEAAVEAEVDAAGPSSSKRRNKKAPAAAAAPAAGNSASARAVKGRKAAAAKVPRKKSSDPYEMDLDSEEEEDEDAPGADEEAELARALSDGDDSDADATSQDESDEEDAPAAAAPAKKRVNSLKPMGPKAALAAAAAALAKRAASALSAGTSKQPKPAAAAAAEEKGAGRKGAGVQAASPSKGKAAGRKANKEAEAEPAGTKSAGSRKRAAAAAPEAADAPAAAAAATVDGPAGRAKRRKQQVPASTMGTGCVRQQTSPVRRSGRQTAAAADDVDGPAASGAAAVSGAGPSTANRTVRPTPAGTAQAAQMEELEMKMFSNTRRRSMGNPSFSRGDSPGVVPNSEQKKKGSSRLAKRRAAA